MLLFGHPSGDHPDPRPHNIINSTGIDATKKGQTLPDKGAKRNTHARDGEEGEGILKEVHQMSVLAFGVGPAGVTDFHKTSKKPVDSTKEA